MAPTLLDTNFQITSVQVPNVERFNAVESKFAVDDEIPTIDYSMLFSDDPHRRSAALQCLGDACDEFGFFYLVNHGLPDSVIEGTLKAIGDFFEQTPKEEKESFMKKKPTDAVMWGCNSHSGENREYLKVITSPQLHCPSNPRGFREALEEYFGRFELVKIGLAKAISMSLGFEESYIEKAFNLHSGFDVAAMNLYPPGFQSKGSIGVPSHTDPGFIVSLIQDLNGGLQVLTHKGKWVNAHIPRNAFLIQLGDHLEVLTNGRYKSHVHHVVVDNNKARRISLATLHGPSLDTFISPKSEFVDVHNNPPAYIGMTYKDSLQANGHGVIEVQSCLDQLRVGSCFISEK